MRELKFRAWDSDTKKMGYFDLSCICDYGNVISTDNGPFFDVDMPIMQYTGMKDKNDKEIYEDDIVKVPPYRTISFNYPECIAIVIYKKESCSFDLSVVHEFDWEELEVIGNTYENHNVLIRMNNGET